MMVLLYVRPMQCNAMDIETDREYLVFSGNSHHQQATYLRSLDSSLKRFLNALSRVPSTYQQTIKGDNDNLDYGGDNFDDGDDIEENGKSSHLQRSEINVTQ